LFRLSDGLYVLPEVRKELIAKQQIKQITARDYNYQNMMNGITKPSLRRSEFLAILEKKKELQQKQQHHQQLLTQIENKLSQKKEYFALIKQRDEMRDHVNHLREEYLTTKEAVDFDSAQVTELKSILLPRAIRLKEGEIELLAEQKRLEREKEARDEKMQQYKRTMYYLKRDVLDLVHQLRMIYTITNVKGDWVICGFLLPNSDFTGCDEELISVALGHVCHLMFMLAKYLDVPLRYQMIPRCSRSAITDDITNKGQYPLYSTRVDRTRFEYAVFLLNKNLEQLLHSRKLEVKSLKETLPNLNYLLTSLENERERLLASVHTKMEKDGNET